MIESPLEKLLTACRVLEKGFVAPNADTVWRLGAVLFADRGDAFAVVRKAPVEGANYEFADLLALPGGMVRRDDTDNADATAEPIMLRSLDVRVAQEASLGSEDRGPILRSGLGPIVTSYTAKGNKCYTLMVAHTCTASAVELKSNDHSIADASWMPFSAEWERFAPANRLVVSHLIWDHIGEAEQKAARSSIEEAIQKCSCWAGEIGFAPPPGPWAKGDDLEAWRVDWSDDANRPKRFSCR